MISTERSTPMSNHPRRVLTPGASRKRKERDGLDALNPSTITWTTTIPTAEAEPGPALALPPSSNRLLAGYLAHEFLTHGTLFGQKWDPAMAKGAPITTSSSTTTSSAAAETKMVANAKAVEDGGAEQPTAAHQGYAAVANLMKADRTHIPGIVNPTQLSRWLQI